LGILHYEIAKPMNAIGNFVSGMLTEPIYIGKIQILAQITNRDRITKFTNECNGCGE